MALLMREHRRNPTRNRKVPKRFEDEKFVCGSVDRYQHAYDGWYKEGSYVANCEDAEKHFTNRRGLKWCELRCTNLGRKVLKHGEYRMHYKDFPESLLEFSSIWRDMGFVLPGALVSQIGEYLEIKQIDKQLVEADDEFIVNDEEEEEVEVSNSDEEEFDSEEETDDDEEWDSEGDESDSDAKSENDEDIPTHDGWNHRWGCPPLKNNKK
jgi:hypothetical protein